MFKGWKEADLAYPHVENGDHAFSFISSLFSFNYEVKFVVKSALLRMEVEKKLDLGRVNLSRVSAKDIWPVWGEEEELIPLVPRLGLDFCPDKVLVWLALCLSSSRPTGQTVWVITRPIETYNFLKGNFVLGFSLKRNRQVVLSSFGSFRVFTGPEDEFVFALPGDRDQTLV